MAPVGSLRRSVAPKRVIVWPTNQIASARLDRFAGGSKAAAVLDGKDLEKQNGVNSVIKGRRHVDACTELLPEAPVRVSLGLNSWNNSMLDSYVGYAEITQEVMARQKPDHLPRLRLWIEGIETSNQASVGEVSAILLRGAGR